MMETFKKRKKKGVHHEYPSDIGGIQIGKPVTGRHCRDGGKL